MKRTMTQAGCNAVSAGMLVLILSGCGGGGGESLATNSSPLPITAPTTPVALNFNSADVVTGVILRDEVGADIANSTNALSQSYGMTRANWVAARLGGLTFDRMDAHLQSAVTSTALDETVSCSTAGTATYTSPAGAASFGATYSNCGVEASSRVNGTLSITGYKGNYTVGAQPRRTVTGKVTVTDAQRTVRIESSLDYTVTCQDIACDTFDIQSLSGRGAYGDGTNSVVSTVSLGAGSVIQTTLAGSEMNGAVSYDDSDPQAGFGYISSDAFPVSGYQVYKGANGSKMRITVIAASSAPGPHVRTEVDANGDDQYEITLEQSWSGALN